MTSPASWLPRLARARSEDELVAIVREYLGAWGASDLDRLPPQCRLAPISTGQDISLAAVTLVQYELKGGVDERTVETVRALADVFVAAQRRLREILGGPALA